MYFFYYVPVGINITMRRSSAMTWIYAAICTAVFVGVRFFPDALPLDLYNLIYTPGAGNIVNAISAAFLHFGTMHLVGNLLYLVFFGRYVEDRMGPFLFTLVFLSSAGIGNYAQGLFNIHVLGSPYTGIIGASGAISGILGAFCVRFMRSSISVAYWVFFPLQAFTRAGRAEIPAVLAVGLWFLLQVARGLVQFDGASANVAYMTHIVGFIWGALLAVAFGQLREGNIEGMLQAGHRYMRKGEPYAAQGAYIRYITHRPGDAHAYAALARAMLLSGSDDGATKHYRRACELFLDAGERGEAEAVYIEALRGCEEFVLAAPYQMNMAFGLERNLKAAAAIKAYENFERRYPQHAEASFMLLRAAVLYRQVLGKEEEAEACYRRLVDTYPGDRWEDFAIEQLRRLRCAHAGGN